MLINSDTQATRLRSAAAKAGYDSAMELAAASKMNKFTVRAAWQGARPLTPNTATKLAGFLKVPKSWLLFGETPDGMSDAPVWPGIDSRPAPERPTTASSRELAPGIRLAETIQVKGTVRPGLFGQAHLWPKGEWITMYLPTDARFPGVTRHALVNEGHAMNRVCSHGGIWVYVLFADLPGQGPSVGQYVIVERERKDGTVECSAKRFMTMPGGAAMLFSDSEEPGYEPISLVPHDAITKVRVVGRVTHIVNAA